MTLAPDTSGAAAALYIGEVSDFDEVALLWERYKVNFGLIDERPEERKAKEFANQFAGRTALLRWTRPSVTHAIFRRSSAASPNACSMARFASSPTRVASIRWPVPKPCAKPRPDSRSPWSWVTTCSVASMNS